MRSKKITPNKDFVIKVRVTQGEMAFVLSCCSALGCTRSDFIRMMIDKNMSIIRKGAQHENEKTDINY